MQLFLCLIFHVWTFSILVNSWIFYHINIHTLHFFSSIPASELSKLWFLLEKLKFLSFGELGLCYFMMGTASAGYPCGITVHSHGKIGALPQRMNFSSSSFPLNVELSRIHLYPSSGPASTSKVCRTFLLLFIIFICFNLLFGCQETGIREG